MWFGLLTSAWLPLGSLSACVCQFLSMWFQLALSVDCVDRLCLSGICNATVGCKLLPGCWKCCGASSAKWRFSGHCNVGNFLLKCCSPLALWFFPKYSTLKIYGRIFFRRLGAHDLRCPGAAAPLVGLPDLAVGCPEALCFLCLLISQQ